MELKTHLQICAEFRAQLDKGDIDIICKRSGTSQRTLFNAWKRDSIAELKGKELRAYETFVDFVSAKIERRKRLELKQTQVNEKIE